MATIMVVDDDVLVRNILKEVLRLNGHYVVEAEDGQEALELVNPDALPDLIFMDHHMPRRTGIDCVRQLKALYPSLKIVLMTGGLGIDDDGYLAANKHLFADIILKPFQIRDVEGIVDYALGKVAAHRPKTPSDLWGKQAGVL